MKQQQDIVKPEPANTAIVSYDYGSDAGVGIAGIGSEHFQLPYLNLLQALSPQAAGGEGEIVEGARPGMFYNSVGGELYDGKEGVVIQPVHVRHCYVEWIDRNEGGGKVGEHLPESPLVIAAKERAKSGATDWNDLRTADNHILDETYYMLALLHQPDDGALVPIMLSLTSTKIKPYKVLMTRLSSLRGSPPIYANTVTLKSVSERNSANQPFHNIVFSPGRGAKSFAESLLPPDSPAFISGKQLRIIASTLKVAPAPAPEKSDSNCPI